MSDNLELEREMARLEFLETAGREIARTVIHEADIEAALAEENPDEDVLINLVGFLEASLPDLLDGAIFVVDLNSHPDISGDELRLSALKKLEQFFIDTIAAGTDSEVQTFLEECLNIVESELEKL